MPNTLAPNDPATDGRTPDFIVGVGSGMVCTAGSKIAEHGGMNENDRSVMSLVSAPDIKPGSVPALVETTQIAPTILKALDLDVIAIQAERREGTQMLPGLPF